jgi:hypothetical protein
VNGTVVSRAPTASCGETLDGRYLFSDRFGNGKTPSICAGLGRNVGAGMPDLRRTHFMRQARIPDDVVIAGSEEAGNAICRIDAAPVTSADAWHASGEGRQ